MLIDTPLITSLYINGRRSHQIHPLNFTYQNNMVTVNTLTDTNTITWDYTDELLTGRHRQTVCSAHVACKHSRTVT